MRHEEANKGKTPTDFVDSQTLLLGSFFLFYFRRWTAMA